MKHSGAESLLEWAGPGNPANFVGVAVLMYATSTTR
jgi:hypothetical protein